MPQRAGTKRFSSKVQLLETPKGERLVRFSYAGAGGGTRGPVTLRERDIGRLKAALAQHPASRRCSACSARVLRTRALG